MYPGINQDTHSLDSIPARKSQRPIRKYKQQSYQTTVHISLPSYNVKEQKTPKPVKPVLPTLSIQAVPDRTFRQRAARRPVYGGQAPRVKIHFQSFQV